VEDVSFNLIGSEGFLLLLVLVVIYAIGHGYRCWRRGERFWGEPGDY
jgi:hypothetical protein